MKLKTKFCIVFIAIYTFLFFTNLGQFGLLAYLLPFIVINVLSALHRKSCHMKIEAVDIQLYAIYLVVFYICTFFNGDEDMGRNSLTIQYLSCIFIFLAISYNVPSLQVIKKIINVLAILSLVNCIITVLQFYNNSIGWGIWTFLNADMLIEANNQLQNINSGQEINAGGTFCPGIFPTQVFNGYVLASLGVICACPYPQIKNWKKLHFIVATATLIALFCAQQRMAFYIYVLFLAYLFYKKHKIITIFILIAALFSYSYISDIMTAETLGRFANAQDSLREKLYSSAITYLQENIIVGGRLAYIQINKLSVHNIFLNAFLYGGIFGGIIILIIYFRMCFKAIRIIIRRNNQTVSTALAIGLLSYNLISLTHNNSLLTGEPIIWIMYALMLMSLKYENEKKSNIVE